MRPGDRLVCAFVEPIEVGQRFREWPLHVTVVPWFQLDKDSRQVATDLQAALGGVKPFEARLGETARFGHNRDKMVNLVVTPTPFLGVEKRVREYLKSQGAWLVDETTRQQRKYKPHVTAQKNVQPQAGDAFAVDHLCVVEQKGDYKELVESVSLL